MQAHIENDEAPETLESLAIARATMQRLPLADVAAPVTALALRGNAYSYAEAFSAAGLGWEVEKVPLYMRENDAKARVAPGCYGMRRKDTGTFLGPVGSVYTPMQNMEIGATVDALMRSVGAAGLAPVRKVASFREGQECTAALALPQQLADLMQVRRDMSSRTPSILLRWSHDGSCATRARLTIFRDKCTNILHAYGVKNVYFNLRHTTHNSPDLENKARAWFAAIGQGIKTMGETLRALDAKPLDATQVVALVGEILDPEGSETRQAKAKIDSVIELIETRDGVFVPAGPVTRLSLLEAFTAYDAHRVPVRGATPEARAERRYQRAVGDDGIAALAWKTLTAA